MKQNKNFQGQSLFEVILALALITLILITLTALSMLSVRNTSSSKNKSLSTRLTQEAIEWLRSQKDSNWDFFYSQAATPIWCLPTLSWEGASVGPCSQGRVIPQTPFRREVNFSSSSSDSIEAVVIVYWYDGNNYQESKSSTLFTNWQ